MEILVENSLARTLDNLERVRLEGRPLEPEKRAGIAGWLSGRAGPPGS